MNHTMGGSGWELHPRPKIVGCSNVDGAHLVARKSDSAEPQERAIRTR
jgi:hypothetical protein